MKHARQQGPARQGMHHLRQGGAHALALSGGKDNGAQGHDDTAAQGTDPRLQHAGACLKSVPVFPGMGKSGQLRPVRLRILRMA